MTILAWAVIGYVAGCLPSAWLVALMTGNRGVMDDVQRNIGEADAHVLLQEKVGRAAISAAAMDVLKGFTPVIIATRLTGPYEIAACAVAAVAGHCWPPIKYRWAGRGLATGAGVFLAFLPFEFVIAGLLRVLGTVVKAGGLLSTVGYVLVPLIALARHQPAPYVLAAAAINVLIFLRRLEGLEEDVRAGVPLLTALWRRVVLDASASSR